MIGDEKWLDFILDHTLKHCSGLILEGQEPTPMVTGVNENTIITVPLIEASREQLIADIRKIFAEKRITAYCWFDAAWFQTPSVPTGMTEEALLLRAIVSPPSTSPDRRECLMMFARNSTQEQHRTYEILRRADGRMTEIKAAPRGIHACIRAIIERDIAHLLPMAGGSC